MYPEFALLGKIHMTGCSHVGSSLLLDLDCMANYGSSLEFIWILEMWCPNLIWKMVVGRFCVVKNGVAVIS